MHASQFISALVENVHEAAVADVCAYLESPPRTRHPHRTAALSEWYGRLSEADQANVQAVIEQAVHATLLRTLCVLDGSHRLSDDKPAPEFQLLALESGASQWLNDPTGQPLHDLYQGQVYTRVFR
jgi:hypothetical protein